MIRVLFGSELDDAVRWMTVAADESKKSPCLKDKRGVVVVKNNVLIGKGYNGPPAGFLCDDTVCKPICRVYSVHAEMRALAYATAFGDGEKLKRATMYHARVENGVIVDSRKPRCPECSKHVLEFGLANFVLKHAEGYVAYDVQEFHRLSLENYVANLKAR